MCVCVCVCVIGGRYMTDFTPCCPQYHVQKRAFQLNALEVDRNDFKGHIPYPLHSRQASSAPITMETNRIHTHIHTHTLIHLTRHSHAHSHYPNPCQLPPSITPPSVTSSPPHTPPKDSTNTSQRAVGTQLFTASAIPTAINTLKHSKLARW